MKNTKEKVLKEPEDFDVGDEFQMEIYSYGFDQGKNQNLASVGKVIDELEIKQTDGYRVLKELKQRLGIK